MDQKRRNDSAPERDPGTIATHNDWLRAHLTRPGHNRVVMTRGMSALVGDVSGFPGFHRRAELLRIIRDQDDFNPANNPHRERDMGAFDFEGTHCLWKIDYYDASLTAGAADPADPDTTVRVLTIMCVNEY